MVLPGSNLVRGRFCPTLIEQIGLVLELVRHDLVGFVVGDGDEVDEDRFFWMMDDDDLAVVGRRRELGSGRSSSCLE